MPDEKVMPIPDAELAELQRKHGELACELLSAAQVIEAAEKAISGRKKLFGPQPAKLDAALIWRAQDDLLEAWEDDALALCTRWKEANGGK